ncbi:MAG: helix-turn-helix transcriptional regulator [Parabacteroides sp.]|nr:helix-turn-helix transcriptional regulator [Parabacteroides sp.]
MITGKQIREFRELRGLSLRGVAKFCEISPQLIGQVETGVKPITNYNYWQIINGINKAFAAKQNKESE